MRKVQHETGTEDAYLANGQAVPASATPELTVVAPTRNEAAGIGAFIESLDEALSGIHAELIVVDDSDDSTPEIVVERGPDANLEVALIHRAPGERDGGLGGAVVAGIAAARAPWVCVMDADLQHPPEAIAELLRAAQAANARLVVASRFCDGRRDGRLRAAAHAGLPAPRRGRPHRVPAPPARRHRSDERLLPRPARRARPRRAPPDGFKILLEILVQTPRPAPRGGRRSSSASAGTARARRRSARALRYLRQLSAPAALGAPGARRFGPLRPRRRSAASSSTRSRWPRSPASLGCTTCSPRRCSRRRSPPIWNYALTERLGLPRPHRPQVAARAGAAIFFAINNVALRRCACPLLYCPDTGCGVHYLASNLITLVRRCSSCASRSRTAGSGRVGARDQRAFNYDIHGLVTVGSDVALPELERFRIDGAARPPDPRPVDRLGRIASPRTTVARTTRVIRYRECGARSASACADRATGDGSHRCRGPPARPPVARTCSTRTSSSRSCGGRFVERATRWCTAPASPPTATRTSSPRARTPARRRRSSRLLDRLPARAFLSDDLTLVARTDAC